MVGPDYKPPTTTMPAKWYGPTSQPTSRPAPQAQLINWWTTFKDPQLTGLEERAVKGNLDIKLAQSRIRQARAQRGISQSPLWPTLDATAGYSRTKASNVGRPRDLFQVGLDAAWELDVFGGTRRDIESADASIQAADEGLRNTLVTLMAEVALDYIDLRGSQQQIFIAKENLQAQQKNADLTRKKFQGGLVGALDVANADAQVATTASTIPLFEQSARQTIYAISVLLGAEPGALANELMPIGKIPLVNDLAQLDVRTIPNVPLGVPSDLLRRRPDIRQAEAQLHAATAQIGVATADLYPKFTITANAGLQAPKFKGLFNAPSGLWSVAPSVDWQIFNGGRVPSNIELQRAFTQETFITYQQTVLTALQDVENALIASSKEYEHRKALADAVTYNVKAVSLAVQLYTQGLTDFLNVLDAQRSLFASQDALVQSNRTVSTNLVALYKALGGGWDYEKAGSPETFTCKDAVNYAFPPIEDTILSPINCPKPGCIK
jgi:NodT family efflux transporter outer membrane factor (OMF) lipoprotein